MTMRYTQGEPTSVTFDTSAELQALGWACSEMRDANPDDAHVIVAYQDALRASDVRHNGAESKDFTLSGERADRMLSVLQHWVALGPPRETGQVTDAARAKSYKTASRIVAQTVELTQN
jgi:hypothetical protein